MKTNLTLLNLLSELERETLISDALSLRELVMYDNLIDLYIEQCDFYREAPECTDIISTQLSHLGELIGFLIPVNGEHISAYMNARCIVAGRTENLPFEGIKCKWHVTAGYDPHARSYGGSSYQVCLDNYELALKSYERASKYTWRTLAFVGAY